jgi:hypothetical protein
MSSSNGASVDKVTWWEAALLIRGQTEADKRNIRAIWFWCFAWAVSFSAVMITLEAYPQLNRTVAWLLGIIPLALGIPSVNSFLRFLRQADEFQRKVQLEGIAIGFGAGSVFCIGSFALEHAGAPQLPLIVAVVPMMLGWAVGSFIVAARYR